jgi:hypothetical protein
VIDQAVREILRFPRAFYLAAYFCSARLPLLTFMIAYVGAAAALRRKRPSGA